MPPRNGRCAADEARIDQQGVVRAARQLDSHLFRRHDDPRAGIEEPTEELARLGVLVAVQGLLVVIPKAECRHRLAAGSLVVAKSILGGLHHEYSLATVPAIS